MNTTSGKEWRKLREEGLVIELPSGNVVRLRPVQLDMLLLLGRIPDALTQVVEDMIFGRPNSLLNEDSQTIEDLRLLVEFYDAICKSSFVSPRIVDKPQADDEINIEDVSLEDRRFVAELVNKPASELARFHPNRGQENVVASMDDQQDVEQTPQRLFRRGGVGKRKAG